MDTSPFQPFSNITERRKESKKNNDITLVKRNKEKRPKPP